jgi:NitT/TauT family transport system substrate-binding protein
MNANGNSFSKKAVLTLSLALFIMMGFLAVTGINTTAAAADKVSVRMNWYWGGIHTPFFLAKERGYYSDNGIDITIEEGRGSGTTVKLVGNKSNDFGLADAGTSIIAATKGVPIKCVFTLNKSDLAVVFLEKTNIKKAKDLEGKKIAVTAGDSLHQMFPAVMKANNLDEKKIKLLFMDPAAKPVAVMEGRVDALLGGITDQPVIMRNKGFPTSTITFSDLGVPTVGLAICANSDMVKNNPDLVKRFVAATAKGWVDAVKDPNAAVEALLKYHKRDRKVLIQSLEVITQNLLYSQTDIGPGDIKHWQSTYDILNKYRGLKSDKPIGDFITNEFFK